MKPLIIENLGVLDFDTKTFTPVDGGSVVKRFLLEWTVKSPAGDEYQVNFIARLDDDNQIVPTKVYVSSGLPGEALALYMIRIFEQEQPGIVGPYHII